MDYSVLLLVCGVIHLAGKTGGVYIKGCDRHMKVEIRDKAKNNITCKDVDAKATITWFIFKRDTSEYIPIATCTPSSCTLHLLTGQFAVQRSSEESQLVYIQRNRTDELRTKIVCESAIGEIKQRSSCYLDFTSYAVLSDCVVEEDRGKGTVKGSCYFEKAYSSLKTFTCTWNQTKSSDLSSTSHAGKLVYEGYLVNGEVYEKGLCRVSISGQQWNNWNYSYTVDFYPSEGPQSVPVRRSDPPLTTTPTPGPPSTPASTGAPQPAACDDEKGEKRVGISVVFAAIGVTLAVVIVGIIAVVVWLKRRQWILPCADKQAGAGLERRGFQEPTQANGERRERYSDVYEIPDTPHGRQGNSRQIHLRDNSPTTVIPAGRDSLSPAGDNSSSTESSLSPAGDNSSTTVNNPPETGDNLPANNYESLRTSDMGLRSVYSALAGPDYYNTGFAAGGTGDSTGAGGEASPIYKN